MSFLAGRLAATEGAYFLQESKQAVNRLAEKAKLASSTLPSSSSNSSNSSKNEVENQAASADVLPEVLKHNLPPNIYHSSSASVANSSSCFIASKWVVQTDTKKNATLVSVNAVNPLRGYVSLPQVTFGPKRWQLPNAENSVLASTANELRREKYTSVNPEKLKAAAAGLSQMQNASLYAIKKDKRMTSETNLTTVSTELSFPYCFQHSFSAVVQPVALPSKPAPMISVGKASVCATILVFGGAILTFEFVASKLELHNGDDLQTKGKDYVQPRFEKAREQLKPLRIWAEETAKKWHLEKGETFRENPLIKELSKTLGTKPSN